MDENADNLLAVKIAWDVSRLPPSALLVSRPGKAEGGRWLTFQATVKTLKFVCATSEQVFITCVHG